MKLITQLKLNPSYSADNIIKQICNKTGLKNNEIVTYEIVKLGIDARHKPNVYYVMNVAIDVIGSANKKLKKYLEYTPDHSGLNYNMAYLSSSPVVVGFGPAGIFSALVLSKAGLNPIVLEQGKCVEERQKDVDNFWNNRVLNPYSNVVYGEGGAGTFSDGKLNSTLNNNYCIKVINELILHGAPKDIYYKNKAHIGTDNLKNVVQNIREEIIKNGGKIIFNAKFCDFSIKNNQISSIFYKNLNNDKLEEIKTNHLILALGHSTLETFEMLNSKGVGFRKKPFAMGVRIEHSQELINNSQYGIGYDKALPSADYKLVSHLPNGRSVFTFCMCPGGSVVASSDENGTVVTNGMSKYARNGKFANSALLVNVNPDDFEGDNVLSGFYFQRQWERKAFELAGCNYNAPAQYVGDFLNSNKKEIDNTANNCQNVEKKYTYLPDVAFCDISKCLPEFVSCSLKSGLVDLDKKLKGFADQNALLIAPETRSSCPVQAVRNSNYTCSYNGLYMCGEGAGYAGGIMSSAVDGIKCAEQIINNNAK